MQAVPYFQQPCKLDIITTFLFTCYDVKTVSKQPLAIPQHRANLPSEYRFHTKLLNNTKHMEHCAYSWLISITHTACSGPWQSVHHTHAARDTGKTANIIVICRFKIYCVHSDSNNESRHNCSLCLRHV